MPKITGYLAGLQLDVEGLKRDLDRELSDILVNGTTEWVKTVAAIVPNWSGMSRASLQPLADLVDVAIFASPVAGAPNRVSLGRELALPRPRLVFNENGQYFFEWHTAVFHFIYNENNNANLVGFHLRNPGPYHSMREAERSFFATVNPALRTVQLDIGTHVKVIRIQFR